jgi:hypothetical protein
MKRRWLAPYSWEFIQMQNEALCAAKKATHGPTTDGYGVTMELWTREHGEEMTLAEAVELCRRSHQLAPFCYYNGNTFAAVIRDVIHQLKISEMERVVLRSLAGHIVAGVASEEEEKEFRKFCGEHGM